MGARRHTPLSSPADQPRRLATVSLRINKAHSGYSLEAVNPSEEVTNAFPGWQQAIVFCCQATDG